MINAPRASKIMDPQYDKSMDLSQNNGILSASDNPAGDALGNALQNRRQKLAEKKIGLFPTSPEDSGEQ